MKLKRKVKKGLFIIACILVFVIGVIFLINKNTSNKSLQITQITAINNTVTLEWEKNGYFTKYNIYRKTDNQDYEKIKTISNNTYTDTDLNFDSRYTYKIEIKSISNSICSDPKEVTIIKMAVPELVSVDRYSLDSKEYAKIEWKSDTDKTYDVLRKKDNEDYEVISNFKSTSNQSTYTDKNIEADCQYTYSIRESIKKNEMIYNYSEYDQEGITAISIKPEVSVDFTNLHALISWDNIDSTNTYKVYRKIGLNGQYKEIATIDSSNEKSMSYKDIYQKSFTDEEEKKLLCAGYFVDASTNSLVYTVRGYKNENGKESFGNYLQDGDFHLEAPSIVSVTKNDSATATIEWCTVQNAKEYYLYSGYNDESGNRHWKKVGEVKQQDSTRIRQTVKVDSGHDYFTVKAVSTKNGEEICSTYDKGFTIKNRNYENKNVLFFGDSITFGSPYKGKTTRDVFSYPWRVQQLTNINYYNPSIPGSTYTYKNQSNRSRMIQIANCLRTGRNVTEADLTKNGRDGVHKSDMYVYKTNFVNNQINGKRFEDFDVVVMAVGTNDYLDDAKLGNLDSKNIYEFNGAINTIIDYIDAASKNRVMNGKSEIKIVFIDLFYSDRTYDYSQKTNRFETKNKIGLTLTDYQNDIDKLVKNYKSKGLKVYQYDNTTINTDNCPYMTSDNLHMNRFAYTQIGNEFTKYLIENKII